MAAIMPDLSCTAVLLHACSTRHRFLGLRVRECDFPLVKDPDRCVGYILLWYICCAAVQM